MGASPASSLDEELARAVRTESAAAIRYWWCVRGKTVAWWRKRLGVTLTNNPESNRLIHAAAKAGAAAMQERGSCPEASLSLFTKILRLLL